MYPTLILRSELVCLVILIFLYFTSRAYKINDGKRAFSRILRFALVHVLFDVITVITVNHTSIYPAWINWIFHVVFYLSAILFSHEIFNYVLALCYPRRSRMHYRLGHGLILAYICCLSFLKIEYVQALGTRSSAGPAAVGGYALAFLFFTVALVLIFTHMDRMPTSVKSALIPMMLVLMIAEVCQMIWRSLLFTGGAVTIVTVGFFFSLENPAAVFKQQAMTDALTGVRSRSSYEEDIRKYDRRIKRDPAESYTVVFCDLNDLHSVNNRFGHAEGDNYIILIAGAISRCMENCSAVYRIGGDEFLILYHNIGDETVEREIRSLQTACAKASEKLNYTAMVSAGYAKSSPGCSIRDVVKTADYVMYQNKVQQRRTGSSEDFVLGASLNYTGLTDRIFDAMCASNDRNYPFITNLDTNVTRIAPAWKTYFGLDAEFYEDFISVWKERIHPDHYDGFMEDVIAVTNGHRQYHNFDYLARKTDGDYVLVSCHGSVYRDSTNGCNYFAGFMVNAGMEENTEPVTGMKSFDALTTLVCRHMDNSIPSP